MDSFFNKIFKLLNNRLAIIFIAIVILFSILIVKLYNLQIINGEFYKSQIKGTILKELTVPAPRGTIYDRYGRPLAVNNSSFTVNIDASVIVEDFNNVLLNLVSLLEKNNENIVDDFPISKTKPYIFLLDGSETKEKRWKEDMGLDKTLTAEEAFYKLRNKFDIDDSLSDEEARKILSIRCELYKKRYSKYIPFTVAYDIKKETIGAIEEKKSDYPGIYIDVEALRYYPSGKYLSHLLGYIRGITDSELATYKQYGYDQSDVIGKEGIEKTFELQLNGVDGKTFAEVDSLGRRINTIEAESVDPIPGDKVFLTVDEGLQKATFDVLEDTLKNTLISRLTGRSKEFNFSLKQLLMSMVDSNNIEIDQILEAKEATMQDALKKYILSVDATAKENKDLAKQILIDGIDRSAVSSTQIILTMHEQGLITADEAYLARIKSGNISSLTVILDKMNSGEITPQMTAMDPCTGSVVVTDVETGSILASVSYPSYDNNDFITDFNEHYSKLQNDPTTPLVNRPLMEPRAPGSTFKMIPAIAGLEEGYITPNSTTYDKGTFTDAGKPYARCWIGNGSGSHGSVNVSHALEVSCNYYFYDFTYRMGNSNSGTTLKGIQILNKYMTDFGLNDFTGVEISELYDSRKNYPSNISSPEYKKYIFSLRNPNTPKSELDWRDGDTIRTAIGQSFNNYTSATLAKYINTLANGGKRYSLHYLDKITEYDGTLVEKKEPILESVINIKPQNLKAVHEGMLMVTTGSKGTLRSSFNDFPVNVAAKSGTSQQTTNRSDHTIFVGFAPYENPQIAITVMIPFGNDTTSPAPYVAKKVIEEYLKLNSEPERSNYNTLTK